MQTFLFRRAWGMYFYVAPEISAFVMRTVKFRSSDPFAYMANDRALGGAILVGSVLGIIVYIGLLWFFTIIILEITASLGVIVLLGILGWIGWTMATTPPPEPMPEMTATGGQSSTSTTAPSTGSNPGGTEKKSS